MGELPALPGPIQTRWCARREADRHLFGLRAAAGDLTPALLSACRRGRALFTMSLRSK